jgi:hypothetical protein
MLWLIASESRDGSFDADPKLIAFRLRANAKDVENALSPLIDGGFFECLQDASKTLVSDASNATSEKTETETETEGRKRPRGIEIPEWVPKDAWDAFVEMRKKKGAFTDYAQRLALGKLTEIHARRHDPRAVIEAAVLNGWKSFYEPKGGGKATMPDYT